MCQYTLRVSSGQTLVLLRTRNPKALGAVLADIRVKPCHNPTSSSSSGVCKDVSFRQIDVKLDPNPCCSCSRGHRDGSHVAKPVFFKLLGTNVACLLKKLYKEIKAKQAAKQADDKNLTDHNHDHEPAYGYDGVITREKEDGEKRKTYDGRKK